MKKYAFALTAAALSLAAASPALAGWDRTQVVDPAYSHSYDRQIERAAERLSPLPVERSHGSAVATHDAFTPKANSWFGPALDRAAGRIDSPHGN